MALNKFKKLVKPLINYLGRKKIAKNFSAPPIIIGGCARSGTTLLLSILSAHPQIYAFPNESAAFMNWKQKQKAGQKVYQPTRIDRFYRHMLTKFFPQPIKRWCEKTPKNVIYFQEILNYFGENVRLVHIIRDGRDVMLSQHPDKNREYWVDPERWLTDVKAGLKYESHSQVLTIKYEKLITSYSDTIAQLCEFSGLEYTAELEEWWKHTTVRESAAWDDTVKQLHDSSIEKWKREENQARVQEVMQNQAVVDLLARLDYKV